MRNYLKPIDYASLGRLIVESYKLVGSERIPSIFLCGGKLTADSARYQFLQRFRNNKNISFRFPEGLFDELLERGAYNLLELEEILAQSVDAIGIFPESPGSWAELGAFTENEHLRKRIICIAEKKYINAFSFINLGPIRVLKKTPPSKVISFKYTDLNNEAMAQKLFSDLIGSAKRIKREFPTSDSGLFRLEEMIIFSLYCLESADWKEIKSIYSSDQFLVSKEKFEKIYDICVNMLLTQGKIEKDEHDRFVLSSERASWIENTLNPNQLRRLRQIRIEVMNASYRRHAIIKHDRVSRLSP